MKKNILILLCAAIAFSCSSDKKARINGVYMGVEGKSVYLEMLTTTGREVVDSTVTSKKGNFKFKVNIPTSTPTFFNVKCENGVIPLIVSPKETVELNSIGNFARGYSVSGSNSSSLMKDFNDMLETCITGLDSLSNIYADLGEDEQRQNEIIREYSSRYYQFKRDHIRFIVTNASNMASVYALYQRLPSDQVLFNGEGDLLYYQMVADSIGAYYPDSPHLIALLDEIAQSESIMDVARRFNESAKEGLNYPDLRIKDIYGDERVLSLEAKGKVMLIDFWTMSDNHAAVLNAELKELYAEQSKNGFEIYQISLDTNKSAWVLSVQNQKLPWINVNDFLGQRSSSVSLYNITSVPSNFLIDKDGNIVAKNIYGDELEAKVRSLLK
ncbi:MAG: TlpA disulfide reductase family protein [Rikenellaceae bacterium]